MDGSVVPGTGGMGEGLTGGFYPQPPKPTTDRKPRCGRCSKVLAWEVTRPWRIQCSRCGVDNGKA